MNTTAWTEADIATLERAIGSGVMSVTLPCGTSNTYRTLAEMRQILATMKIAVRGHAQPPIRAIRVTPRSGY